MTGFSKGQLRDKALLGREEVVQETRYRRVRHTLTLRFSLAYLWALSAGDRKPFDEFWRSVAEPKQTWRFPVSRPILECNLQPVRT